MSESQTNKWSGDTLMCELTLDTIITCSIDRLFREPN
jgi:hypothetical protein